MNLQWIYQPEKDGGVVALDKLEFSNLNARFGDKCPLKDFNVNGYLFADNYVDECRNFLVSFDVSTDKIDLEGFSADIEYKTEILIKYAIMELAYYEIKSKPFF